MKSLLWYLVAALGEIAGCFSFWAWRRMSKSPFWTIPGVATLILFALALTQIDSSSAGRAYAAYGGIYILSSLLWLWGVENTRPDRGDIGGAAVCLIGVGIILFGPRNAKPANETKVIYPFVRLRHSLHLQQSWRMQPRSDS